MKAIKFCFLVNALALVCSGSNILSNFRVVITNETVLSAIAERFEVHSRTAQGYEVYVPANRAKEFLEIAPSSELLEYDIRATYDRLKQRSPSWLAGYHTFSQVEEILADYEKVYPSIATRQRYGTSKQGNPLYALRLSAAQEPRAEVLITAATHGDELITVEVVLGIMEALIKNFAINPQIRGLLEEYAVYFVPVVNPDGFKTQDRYDNGRDPNRSYPWPQNPSNTPTGSVGPLIEFVSSRKFAASIDFHASGEMIMYPWAYTHSSPPSDDEKEFVRLGRMMAQHNDYSVGQISKIIYLAPGSSADYFYWKLRSVSFGIEIARSKVPHSSEIPAVLEDNLHSTLAFIQSF